MSLDELVLRVKHFIDADWPKSIENPVSNSVVRAIVAVTVRELGLDIRDGEIMEPAQHEINPWEPPGYRRIPRPYRSRK